MKQNMESGKKKLATRSFSFILALVFVFSIFSGAASVGKIQEENNNNTTLTVTLGTAPPNITSFAPPSHVNDTVCNLRTFYVTVNQTVNVSWYLNESFLFTNESVTEASCTLHAEVIGKHSVSAIASNPSGTDMQTWIWNVLPTPTPTPAVSTNVTVTTDATYINITAGEAKQMMDENQSIVILDVRTFAEYKSGHIEGAESLPLSNMSCGTCFHASLDKYKDKTLLAYCRSGIKSEDACNILVNYEFEKVYNMMGGLNAWEDTGFPVVSDSNDSFSSEIDDFLSSDKSVFLFLYVDWCHFCQQQMPIIDELEQEYAENITFIRVNGEEYPEAVSEFEVNGFPAMFLIMGKGEDGQYESQYFRGFTDKETLKRSIDWIIANGNINEKSKDNELGIGASPTLLIDDDDYTVALAGAASCLSSAPGVAPRDPKIPSGALCRHACGSDCPSTCRALPDISICASDGEHICKYRIIECGTHQGCRDHDDCYDACALRSPPVICPWGGQCCRDCDDNCTSVYGYYQCLFKWARGKGPYEDRWLKFSYPPVQTACQGSTPYCVDGKCVECRTNAHCDDKDGWLCNEATDHNHYFDYHCANSKCDSYKITKSKNCNDWDGWHCAGGGQKRQKWDGYCKVDSILVCDIDVLEEETCGANAYCSGGAFHCDEGYHNCDGDWSNGCECPPGSWCEDSECVSECTPCTEREYYEDCDTKEILEIENRCDCTCRYHYYAYELQRLVTEHCNEEGEWVEVSVGDPEIKGDWISHRMEVEPCDIDMEYELESTGLAYLPDPDVPENCEVTGVSVDLIPFYIDAYDSDWYWIDCAKERDLYYWEDGIVEASGNLRCYCENTEQWENKGSYTGYGDYFIEIWETFLLSFQCPDLSSTSQTLSDAPAEEQLSIMNTNNKCFTSQTDGRNGESQSRNIDIDISSRIFPSDTTTHDIIIDPTVSRVLFMVYWAETGSDLYLTLNTPGGIIDPSMASTDPSIDYKENAFYRYYMIHYPEPGNWTMNINAVSVPSDGLDYNVIMNLVSEIPLSLSISTNKDRYNPNEQVIITANLKYNNTPLIGASVVTRILRPDGTVDKLLLFDDGSHDDIQANDGNYSTTYTNTTIKGTYDIIISASGTTPDGDFFNREKSMPIIIVTLTAKFSNTYSDYGTDTDGDGLYDYMTIDVGVNVAVAGDYSMIGLLADADGNNIASAINRTYLDIEDKTLKLIFDGKKIHKHGVDGPYHLKRLALSCESSEIVDSIFDAYATKSYNYIEFQTKLAEFTGTYSDYGTDTDGDGLYDFLTIDVGVKVTTAGDYSINGGLYDANGNDIVWAINSTYLDVENQTVQLNFDGKAIQKHGVEGPYYLKHLGIYDKNRKQIDGVFDAYTTSAYTPTDFEAPLAVLTSDYADYGIDFDGDGLYDYLTVDVGVNVSAAGNYSLMGYLYDVNETEIVWSIDYRSLDVGNHIMHLDFNGKTIQMHGVNGPYYLKHLRLSGENWTFIDYIPDAYNTSAYNYTDFVDPVSTENEVTISGVGLGEIRLIVSYKDTIPVFAGRYSYDLVGINIPQRPNNFTITASAVKNLKLGLKKIQDNTTRIWVTQTFAAPEDKATAQSDLPSPGNYHVKIFGDAADGTSEVDLELTAVKKIKASGDFSLSIDISGFPAGKYTVTAKALNGCFTDLTLDGLPLAP